MTHTYEKNKALRSAGVRRGALRYGSDKIAFFGLLVMVILMAYAVVVLRSAVSYTEPIKLEYGGLSLRMPQGNGWQSEGKWKYQDNSFVLNGFFSGGSTRPTIVIRCKYLLAAQAVKPDVLLKQKASLEGGEVLTAGRIAVETGERKSADEVVSWAHIRGVTVKKISGVRLPVNLRLPFDVFFGTISLPYGRQLDIEVYDVAGQTEQAKKVFRGIAKSLKIKANLPLQAGKEIVTEIKDKGVKSFLEGRSRQKFYLVKDTNRRNMGFVMEVLLDLGQQVELNIQGASYLYIRGRIAREKTEIFQSDDSFEKFVWKSETADISGKSGTELVLGEDSVVTVRKYGKEAGEESYCFGPVAVPDILGELVFGPLLARGQSSIYIDAVSSDGVILPANISVSRLTEDSQQRDLAADAVYMVTVELLDGRGYSEQLYFDRDDQIIRRLIYQDGTYMLEKSGEEEILKEFPERAGDVLRKGGILKQD